MTPKPDEGFLAFQCLPPNAIETLGALFVRGPLWDGDVPSKSGRDALVNAGYAVRVNGWQTLTARGLDAAITADVKHRSDKRWYRKQRLA